MNTLSMARRAVARLRRSIVELKKESRSLCQTLEEWRDDARYYKGLAFELDWRLKKLLGLDEKLKAAQKRKKGVGHG